METAKSTVEGKHRADGKNYSKDFSKKKKNDRLLSNGLLDMLL